MRFTVLALAGFASAAAVAKSPVDYVDSLIGTSTKGYSIGEHSGMMPFVGVPFGSVQWVPMTDPSEEGRVSFDSEKKSLIGYVGTRQMAIWMGEWGQFSFMPSFGDGVPPCDLRARGLPFDDKGKDIYAPYYSRTSAGGIVTECAASAHAAIYRLIFPKGVTPRIVMDASRDYSPPKDWLKKIFGVNVALGGVRISEDRRRVSLWNRDIVDQFRSPRLPNFCARQTMVFSEPFVSHGTFVGGTEKDGEGYARAVVTEGSATCEEDRAGCYVTFAPSHDGPKTMFVKLGVSLIGDREARENLDAEIPGWDFDAVRDAARSAWEEKLGVISIRTPREDVKTIFYTALYHTMLFPREITERGRYYSAFDDKIHEGVAYTGYSLWDTYRSEHALLALTSPERVDGMVQSLVNAAEEGGCLPKYPNHALHPHALRQTA